MENEKGDISDEWEMAPTSKMVSYGFGYIIVNYLLTAYSVLVFYFYEVEIGLPVALVGVAFIIFAIWNMINDPLLGYLTDKPLKWTRKWGMRAPWIVISSFPILICYFFIFTPPEAAKEDVLFIFLYMVIITCLFDTFFSIYNDHLYGGFTNHFRTEYDRRKAFTIIALLAGFGVTFLRLIPPLFITYGDKSSFILAALIMVIILVVFNFILFFGIKESEQLKESFIRGYEKSKEKTFFKTMKIAMKRKNYVVILIAYTIIITTQTLMNASQIYFVKDVLRVPYSYVIYINLAGFAGYLLSIPFWYNFIKKHGFKKTLVLCLFLSGICYLPTLWITTLEERVIYTFLGGIPYAGYTIVIMPVAADTMDDVALQLGRRAEGTLAGIRMFFFRLAFLVQGVVITVIHIFTAYDPDPDAIQTPLAIWGIRVHAGLIPAILMICISLIVLKWYDLIENKKENMLKDLKARGL
ncbi:MAG: MFS transporter [Promethearchaeota archaeon]|nr:MAG: MFS transporter [Candidatus Lokiarchaeota archaeon]